MLLNRAIGTSQGWGSGVDGARVLCEEADGVLGSHWREGELLVERLRSGDKP